MTTVDATDQLLWYDVGGWKDYGLAVPNFGNDKGSKNRVILSLTSVIGRNLQAIMFHDDANVRTPPSINTLTRIHKLVIRARQILGGRSVPENTPQFEPTHTNPSPETFLIYPTPYFKVRNQWLKEYAYYVLSAISEAMQHQENAQSLEISVRFGGLVGQYIDRVYRLMCTELFNVPVAEASDPAFVLTDAHFQAYNPSKWFTSTELIDTVPPLMVRPSEDALEPITSGLAVATLPKLPKWPTSLDNLHQATSSNQAGDSPAPESGVATMPAAPGV